MDSESLQMPAPGLPLPELWDAIISHVLDPYEIVPRKDLKAISLVCSSFCAPAQKALFENVLIHDSCPRETLDNGEERYITKELAIVKAIRFTDLLKESPHLLRYIRYLSIGTDDPECFRIVAAIPWSQLRNLEFRHLSVATLERCPDGVARLLGITSIRTLTIQGCGDRVDFEAVFSYCSPSIEQLGLMAVQPILASGTLPPSACAIRGSPRPIIRGLTVGYSPDIMDILGEAFDFTRLETLHLVLNHGPRLASFFSRYCSTVKCLTIMDKDPGWTDFDPIMHLPKLIQIDVSVSELNLDSFINFLTNITTSNRIEQIKILFCLSSDDTKDLRKDMTVDTARRFEDVVLQPGRLPALRVVQMQVHLFPMLHGIPVVIVPEFFPRLREKGILELI
ncbi:hypothetical protein R3P38DRAFT_3113632 [Favolaschia claudopus]|uniref:F-box domain-containing protein n=1 Tax=Favolaschia claudopus TaxID=2862362 RepID=A0AAV9ZGF0_9AGAR